MRFKAKLAPEQISLLYSLVVSIARASSSSSGAGGNHEGGASGGAAASVLVRNSCYLSLDDECVRVCVKGSHSHHDTAGITCHAELQASGIFMEHRIESVADHNSILMELDILLLRMALQSIQSETYRQNSGTSGNPSRHSQQRQRTSNLYNDASWTVLKLAKRHNTPCLCLDHHHTRNGGLEMHHAIPVRICRAADLIHHLPPRLPAPAAQLEFSSSLIGPGSHTPLKTLVERLRSMSTTVYLTAHVPNPNQGQLEIATDRDGTSLKTVIDRMIPRTEGGANDDKAATSSSSRKRKRDSLSRNSSQKEENYSSDDDNDDSARSTSCTVKVDTKKLALCLQWQQQAALVSTALLCLVENEALVLHAMLNPSQVGFFTYYIPVHFLSDDGGGAYEEDY